MSSSNNNRRLAFATLIAALVLTALFILLKKTPLVIAAYSFGLLGIAELAVTLILLTGASSRNYITRAAFPLVAWDYLLFDLGLSVPLVLLDVCGLWAMPVGWFCFLHILLLAFFAWKMLAMDAGQEAIEEVDQNVRKRTEDWRWLRADAESLLGSAPAEFRDAVAAVRDAIRYADPMSDPALQERDDAIAAEFRKFGDLISAGDAEAVKKQSEQLVQWIRNRNLRAKTLK